VSKDQRAAIFDYFKNPSMEPGKSVKPAPGQMGPGGASTSPINLGGGLDAPKSSQQKTDVVGATVQSEPAKPIDLKTEEQKAAEAEELKKLLEQKQLDALMQDLKEAINKSQALQPFKDQLLLDITPEGLRIQIVDKQNRPMFDLGGTRLKDYTADILREVARYLNSVPNRISLSGHTDDKAYVGARGYSNWDLSADRANAARRALQEGGLAPNKIARVVGLASSVLFDRENPHNPINRRISIIVMTKSAEARALSSDAPDVEDARRRIESGQSLSGEAPTAIPADGEAAGVPASPTG
jgi:chemotaxis protein MotB